MAKDKVRILTGEGPIHWPTECARCCATKKLQMVHAGIAHEVTSVGELALGTRHYQTLGLHYPVCKEHASGAAFASWLTRKSPLPRLLRTCGYFVGIPALPLLPMKLVRSLGGGGRNSVAADPGLFFPLLFAASAVILVLTVLAYRRVPVRLVKLEDDAVTIRFANERFARHFARSNPDLVV